MPHIKFFAILVLTSLATVAMLGLALKKINRAMGVEEKRAEPATAPEVPPSGAEE